MASICIYSVEQLDMSICLPDIYAVGICRYNGPEGGTDTLRKYRIEKKIHEVKITGPHLPQYLYGLNAFVRRFFKILGVVRAGQDGYAEIYQIPLEFLKELVSDPERLLDYTKQDIADTVNSISDIKIIGPLEEEANRKKRERFASEGCIRVIRDRDEFRTE